MALNKSTERSSKKLAKTLLSQRAALVKSHQRLAEIESRVRGYEQRYGMKSHAVPTAINSGQLKETKDVCRWLMDYDQLARTKTR